MAEAGTLHDAFIDELRDTYDAEKQLTKALPKLAKAASDPKLRQAFESHLEETRGQIARLEQVFESLDEKVRGKHCDGIAGIIEEGKSDHGGRLRRDNDGRLPDCVRPARRALRDGRLRHVGRVGDRDGPHGRGAPAAGNPRRGESRGREVVVAGRGRDQPGCRRTRGSPTKRKTSPRPSVPARRRRLRRKPKPARGASTGGVVVLIQLLLPTTFPNGTASQDATAGPGRDASRTGRDDSME